MRLKKSRSVRARESSFSRYNQNYALKKRNFSVVNASIKIQQFEMKYCYIYLKSAMTHDLILISEMTWILNGLLNFNTVPEVHQSECCLN